MHACEGEDWQLSLGSSSMSHIINYTMLLNSDGTQSAGQRLTPPVENETSFKPDGSTVSPLIIALLTTDKNVVRVKELQCTDQWYDQRRTGTAQPGWPRTLRGR